MNKHTKEHNELFNKNCQLFMSKYNIFKSHDNPIIKDIGKLINQTNDTLRLKIKYKYTITIPKDDYYIFFERKKIKYSFIFQ